MKRSDTPILMAVDDGVNFNAWCPHCRRWPAHAREEGHRVAHCDNFGAAHYPHGYEVRLAERLANVPHGLEAGPLRIRVARTGQPWPEDAA